MSYFDMNLASRVLEASSPINADSLACILSCTTTRLSFTVRSSRRSHVASLNAASRSDSAAASMLFSLNSSSVCNASVCHESFKKNAYILYYKKVSYQNTRKIEEWWWWGGGTKEDR